MALVATALGGALALGGCTAESAPTVSPPSQPTTTPVLTIKIRNWSGAPSRSGAPAPRPATHVVRVDAVAGESVTVEALGDDVELTITSAGPDEVELSTSREMAPTNPGGGTSLSDSRSEFTVAREGSTVISTPTMDSGTRLVMSLR